MNDTSNLHRAQVGKNPDVEKVSILLRELISVVDPMTDDMRVLMTKRRHGFGIDQPIGAGKAYALLIGSDLIYAYGSHRTTYSFTVQNVYDYQGSISCTGMSFPYHTCQNIGHNFMGNLPDLLLKIQGQIQGIRRVVFEERLRFQEVTGKPGAEMPEKSFAKDGGDGNLWLG